MEGGLITFCRENFVVCVLSYNHPEITAKAVRSAAPFARKIILIHNGSSPQNVHQLRSNFPDVDHVEIPINCGYSGGVNAALSRGFSLCDWILFLSNDCELLSIPKLPNQPALIAPIIYRRKIEKIDSIGGGFRPSKGKLIHFREEKAFLDAKNDGWLPYLPGSAFLAHKNIFEEVGGLDTTLGTYWDDVDWSVRTTQKGYGIQTDLDFRVLHRVGKTCHANPLYSLYFFQRNRKRVSLRYCAPNERYKLIAQLSWDWLRLGFNLVKRRRFKDLPLLGRAIIE